MSIAISHARTVHLFSVADYERMVETCILTENDRVELIRGEIIDKMTIGIEHSATTKRLNQLFSRLLADRVTIGVQDPVELSDSMPEPDVSLLQPQADFYNKRNPEPKDILLLVEVSDASLDFDRNVKRPLYAENGIREYWIVNLIDRCLEVYRQPQPNGTYSEFQTLRDADSIEIAALPGITLAVSQLL